MSSIEISTEERTAIRNRLARARGQLDAVIRHLDEGGACLDALSQLNATSKAIERATSSMILAGLRCCYSCDPKQQAANQAERERLEKIYLSMN